MPFAVKLKIVPNNPKNKLDSKVTFVENLSRSIPKTIAPITSPAENEARIYAKILSGLSLFSKNNHIAGRINA